MTAQEYLEKLLEAQTVSDENVMILRSHREEVETLLRDKFGSEPSIKYAGSYAKGTMIRESYDLDIVCYFPADCDMTLKEIHDEVEKILSEKYATESKASAVRILNPKEEEHTSTYHIDVVPGRFIEDSDDVFLHVVYGDKERMKTNIKVHIEFVKGSGQQSLIKLAKLWKKRHDLPVKNFALEVFIIRAVEGIQKTSLPVLFTKALEEMASKFATASIPDPANPEGNDVSKTMHTSIKDLVASKAEECLSLLGDTEDLEAWKKVFLDADAEPAEKEDSFTPINSMPQPWSF